MQSPVKKASAGPERRKSSRVSMKQKVQLAVNAQFNKQSYLPGEVVDLSETGVYIKTNHKISKFSKARLYLSLNIAGVKKLFTIPGEIAREDIDPKTRVIVGYGLRFDEDLDPTILEYLKGVVTFETTGEIKIDSVKKVKEKRLSETYRIDLRNLFKK